MHVWVKINCCVVVLCCNLLCCYYFATINPVYNLLYFYPFRNTKLVLTKRVLNSYCRISWLAANLLGTHPQLTLILRPALFRLLFAFTVINTTRREYFVCCCEHDWSRRPENETVPQLVVNLSTLFWFQCQFRLSDFLSTWKLHSTLVSQVSPSVVGPS